MCVGEKLGQVTSARGPDSKDPRASADWKFFRLFTTAERIPVRTTVNVALCSNEVAGIPAIARRTLPSSAIVKLLGWKSRIAGETSSM